jgi:hypothetical protein
VSHDPLQYNAEIERMVNQIALQFALDAPHHAAEKLADHLLRFWDPSMRAALVEQVSAGRMRVTAVVDEAVLILTVAP